MIPHLNVTLEECAEKCKKSSTIFCRRFTYDNRSNTCLLSDVDSFEKKNEVRQSSSQDILHYELLCLDGGKL